MNIFGKSGSGSEYIQGTADKDFIYPLGGSDTVDGQQEYDVVVINWESSNFKISTYDGTTYLDAVSGASSGDRVVLRNVEEVRFTDQTLSLLIPDTYASTPGSDFFNGGPGLDTVTYAGVRSDYLIDVDVTGINVGSALSTEGTDRLLNIERLQFSDTRLAFDFDGHAGEAAKVLSAVFGQESLGLPAYVGIALHLLDSQDYSYQQLVQIAIEARLGSAASDHRSVVGLLYSNLFGVSPGAADLDYLASLLDKGQFTVAEFGVLVADTEQNQSLAGLTGLASTGIEYLMPA